MESWIDLKERYLRALDQLTSGDDAPWLELWRLFVGHGWYQAELAATARRLTRGSGDADAADVSQDATMLLAERLRRKPDLGIERTRAEQSFPQWMRRIIHRDCQQAMRKWRRQRRFDVSLMEVLLDDSKSITEDRIDLLEAVKRLPVNERQVVALYVEEGQLGRVARRLGASYNRTHYVWRRAIENLQSIMTPNAPLKKFVGQASNFSSLDA